MRPNRNRVRVAVLITVSWLACSAGRFTAMIVAGNENQAQSSRAAVESAEAPLPLIRTTPVTADSTTTHAQQQRALGQGGWQSEAAADAAKHQLQALGMLIGHRPIDSRQLAPLLSAEFACVRLRPQVSQVFRDGVATVFRRVAQQEDRPETSYHRLAGCVQALEELLKPFGDGAAVQMDVKLFKVDLDGRTATTHAYVTISARRDAVVLQQNATWVCRWVLDPDRENHPLLERIDVTAFEEVHVRSGPAGLFADCTESVLGGNPAYRDQLLFGIDYWRGRVPTDFGIQIYGMHGLALGDVDNDGLEDVYLCQPGGLPNRLFVHQPDGTVVDKSAESGLDWLNDTTSALLIDLDNDGDQDLVIGFRTQVAVFANDGRGRFSHAWALRFSTIPYSLAAADYNNDGRLDFYVCCYSAASPYTGIAETAPVPWHDANNGAPNHLFRNEGGWRFRDVTEETGLDVNNRRFSFAAAWEDYDNDGDMDLYVANDFGRNNLYRNEGGRFTDVAAAAGVEDSANGMSVTWGDYNRDGRMDLYVSNMFSAAGNRITYQRRFKPGLDADTLQEIRRFARGNSLFENAGDGTFRDVSVEAGVTMGRWAWGSLFADLNNDGQEDLYVANGFITQAGAGDVDL